VAGKQWLKRAPKTVKIFKPNLHVTRLEKNGKKAKVKVCTKCLRRVKKKNEIIHGWRAVQVAIQRVEEKPVVVKEEPSSATSAAKAMEVEEATEGKEEKPVIVEKEVKKPSKGRSASGGKPVKKKSTKKAAKKPAPKKPPAKKAV
jgi:ribosomal protein L28